ncbi:MAG: hypothetical protein E6L04_11220 [Thaumarchaeota archaeon]|nr:MAG: hypothetical protein E6L04_11220 [Nitrososphaerota archaeon]TLX92604.1 MAG: hypothetical protein E6K97_00980 [Nitrososphaerota archaeon]
MNNQMISSILLLAFLILLIIGWTTHIFGQVEGQYLPDKQEMYLCMDIKYVEKLFPNATTDKICKYWTGEEIIMIFGLKHTK